MTLQELIDELNAARDQYGGDLVVIDWDDYLEEYVETHLEVIVFEDGRMRLV